MYFIRRPFYRLIPRLFLWGLLYGLVWLPAPTAAGQETPASHAVEPGDTWLALSWRYDVSIEALRQQNPHPNMQRQPAVGGSITLPDGAAATTGRQGTLVRAPTNSLIAVALRYNMNLWQLAQLNQLENRSRPLLYRPLFIPAAGQTPRELPIGFESLEFSDIPARPGEGIGLRAGIDPDIVSEAALRLGGESGQFVTHAERAVGLLATGAFFRPGQPELSIRPGNQPLWGQPWVIADKEWTFNQVTLSGSAAEISQEDIAAERERLFALWGQTTPAPQWEIAFTEPITGYLEYSSLYGARRSYNGGPYSSYHEGLDFSAYGGTEVFAPAAGTVILAEKLYVRGGAVIINHGLSVYTGYYHLSEVTAEMGQTVSPGDLVGKVGTTGFSSGNHLHWDLLVNGIWVDPAAWLERDLACWLAEGWGRPCMSS